MKLIVIISILSLVQAEENLGDNIINGVRHYKEILFENLHIDFNFRNSSLAVDDSTNDLYVSRYNADTVSKVFNINSKKNTLIDFSSSYPQCVTVDQDTHAVLIGTSNGIYKYNVTTGMTALFGAEGEDVWRIHHYNGLLYYRQYGFPQEIRTLVNGNSVRIHEFDFEVWNFVIDNEENIVSATSDGCLYKHKKGTENSFLFKGIPAIRSLTTDRNGIVYFSAHDGIYEVKKHGAEKVVNIDNPTYIALDNQNNFIYFNDKDLKLYRLKPITKPLNVPNSCSDRHTSQNQELEENIDDIKTELQTMNKKIENLPQLMNMLITNLLDKQSVQADSPRTIHLDNIVLKNINITIGLDEPRITQIPST